MHDQLKRQALQKAWSWVSFIAIVLATLAGVLGLFVGPRMAAAAFVIVLITLPLLSLVPPPLKPKLQSIKAPSGLASTPIQNMVEGVCIALGCAPVEVVEIDHDSINVGFLVNQLIITRGAREKLTKTELESLCAMRLAVAHDASLQRLQKLQGWLLTFRLGIFSMFLLFIGIGLLIPLPIFFFTFGGAALFFLLPRFLWWMSVASDGVAIATTRFPEPLSIALCKVALYNGPGVPMGRWGQMAALDHEWIAPIGVNDRSATYVNDKKVSESSKELESDMRLLGSAQLVLDVCVNGKPSSLVLWNQTMSLTKHVQSELAKGATEVVVGNYIVSLDGARVRTDEPNADHD